MTDKPSAVIQIGGYKAMLYGRHWVCDEPALEQGLNSIARCGSGSMPSAAIAHYAAKVFNGKVLEAEEEEYDPNVLH